MKQVILIMTALMLMTTALTALASDHAMSTHRDATHIYGDLHSEMQNNHADDISAMFLVKRNIDGYDVSFHVMKPTEGMQHGGDHNFMVRIEKDGKALSDLMVNSKVGHKNGKSESKMMMRMGVWYMAGYDLAHAGKHQLMVLFKTSDGQKHFGGVIYPHDK